jgi:PBP1b-binding outer membrane lipoprotein LpoB
MDISCVSYAPPAPAVSPAKAPEVAPAQSTDVKANSNTTVDASTPQPTVLAPLPPGQGTRIDQLV